jgi:UDP-N-acetylglucosamine 2-epimerase (non-hydrolysing)
VKDAKLILTDSGGIQEESTFLQVPCLTLRPNTERPITVTTGSNELVPFEIETILNKVDQIKKGAYKSGNIPPLWDGKTTARILTVLDKLLV